MCTVSVVLPVYNVAAHIQGTLKSILAQSFHDFEILVLDDRSTDDTVAQVQALSDPRIRLIQNPVNLGRAGTDNAALPLVRGRYIAKMDGDDLCHPDRLAKQVAVLEQDTTLNVVGSWMQNFGASTYLNQYPTRPEDAQVLTLFTLPTGNPSVMLRTSLFWELGMEYDAALRQTEDYDFFARYIRQLRIQTLPEALIQYRVPPNKQKTAILSERATVSDEVRQRLLQEWGVPFSARELVVHNTISMLERPSGTVTLAEVDSWLTKLLRFNEQQPLFDQAALQRGLGERWFEVCYSYQQPRLGSVRQYRRSALATGWRPAPSKTLKFWVQALRRF